MSEKETFNSLYTAISVGNLDGFLSDEERDMLISALKLYNDYRNNKNESVPKNTPITNREYMNSMSNKEFANYIYDVVSMVGKDYSGDAREGVAIWLNKPKDANYARAENCKLEGQSVATCLKCGACGRIFKNGYLVTN